VAATDIDPRSLGSRRWWALSALTLAILAVGLDGTVLSVALPTLAHALHASESNLQWFSSSYLLVLAAAMLPMGLLGDRYGRKRVLLISLAAFAAGSLACAISTSPVAFIGARVLLGLAGAGIIVMSLAALTVLFSKDERPRAVGIWAAANFLALPIGPILGGYLLTHFWWGWVFLINVPVVLVGLGAAIKLLPESRASERPGLDPVGVAASVAGLVSLIYGLIEAGEHGWGNVSALAFIAGGLVLLGAFFAWERHLTRRSGGQPLIELALFRLPSYTWGLILSSLVVFTTFGVLFTMPQYFQGVLGVNAMGSGLRLLPLIGGLVVGALPADRVAALIGSKLAVAGGFACLASGLLIGSGTAVASSGFFVGAWMALVGVGMGLALATSTSAALSELSEERSGVGAAALQAINKMGGPLGTAILGSLLSSTYLTHLALSGLPTAAAAAARQSVFGAVSVAARLHSPTLLASSHTAFVTGMDLALMVSGGVALVGLALALLFLPQGTKVAKIKGASTRERVGSHS
jgi:EmrB/QacA subfamily drug resistance transporter